MNEIETTPTIQDFIKSRTADNWSRTRNRFLNGSDRSYWIPSRTDLNGILDKSRIAHKGDQGDVFDCDDYAFTFKSKICYLGLESRGITGGYPIASGIFFGKSSWAPDPRHAGNWFITRENDLVWVEPQYNNADYINNGHNPIRPPDDSVTFLTLMIF